MQQLESYNLKISDSINLMRDLSMNTQKIIMIIDDDIDYCDYISFILSKEGFTVFAVNDGVRALEILFSLNQIPNLIILDLFMPKMSGLEFRSNQLKTDVILKIPVLFLSEYELVSSERSLLKSNGHLRILKEIECLLK